MDKNDNAKKILEAYKNGIDEGKNSTSFSDFLNALGSMAIAPITPENDITKAKELGREEGIKLREEIEEREKEEEERVSAIEEARQEISEDIYDSLSHRYSNDDSYSVPSASNTNTTSTANIGATTERDTFWGNIIGYSILIGVIIGVLLLLIGKMGNFSDPLQHPRSEPTSFSVTIDSSPSGATVFIDKKQVGITPYSTTLEKGSYGIRVEKEGYENDYKITEGENREFNFKLKEE